MRRSENVVIAGGGPAGAYCAYTLAVRGLKPVVIDYSHPREKPCGGGISPHIVKKFPFLEEFREKGLTFGDFKLISCVGTQVVTKGLENGFCISRRCLDQGLLDMALSNGATLAREKVIDVRRKGNSWDVITDKTVFSTKILVGADGVSSIVRRRIVGPISPKNLGLTFGYLANIRRKAEATIRFLAEIPGYIWVFPAKGYVNIGIGSELKHGSLLKKLLDSFLNSSYPQIKLLSRYSAMLPSASDPRFFSIPCAGENWVLIGDAAGHVDPISGGGIFYALWDGELASKAIEDNNPKSFDKMWRSEYGMTLEKRCTCKDDFYDPVKSTLSMSIGLANKTYFSPSS